MAERLKNVPLWYKAASLVIVGLLAACGVDEKLELTPVMTIACSPAQDTLPYATNFRAGASAPLGGEITETSQISPAEIQSFQSEVEKAIACSPYREAIEAAGGSLQTLVIRLADEEGNKQDAVFLVRVGLGGETIPFTVTTETGSSFEVPFFFYSDSKDAFFAPPGQGDPDKPGVLLPIRAWVEGETGYWAFRIETSNATQPPETDSYLFRRDFRTGVVTLREPYSGREYQWKENPQQTTSAMYRVISQSSLMPEGWVDVNGTPVSPEFLSLQEEIAQTDNFTLTPDGLLVNQPDGTIKRAEGVVIRPDGTILLVVDGQEILALEIELDGDSLYLITADGQYYVISPEAPTPSPSLPPDVLAILQAKGIEPVHTDDQWKLKIGELDIPDAHLDNTGEALHVTIAGGEEITIPATEIDEKLEFAEAEGLLRLTDEEGKAIAVYSLLEPETGWLGMITFMTTDGQEVTMPKFAGENALEAGLMYISERAKWFVDEYNFRTWIPTPQRRWYRSSNPRAVRTARTLLSIPGYNLEGHGIVTSSTVFSPEGSDAKKIAYQQIVLDELQGNTVITFQREDGSLEMIYIVGEDAVDLYEMMKRVDTESMGEQGLIPLPEKITSGTKTP